MNTNPNNTTKTGYTPRENNNSWGNVNNQNTDNNNHYDLQKGFRAINVSGNSHQNYGQTANNNNNNSSNEMNKENRFRNRYDDQNSPNEWQNYANDTAYIKVVRCDFD